MMHVADASQGDDRLPRVLMALDLDPSQKFGTLEEQVLSLARAFRDRGARLFPLYRCPLDPEGAGRYAAAGLATEALDLRAFRPSRLARLRGILRRNAIEVVHWNFYPPLTNPYLWAISALAPGVRHVYTDHISRYTSAPGGPPPGSLRAAVKARLARRYASVVCVSEFVRARLQAERTWPVLRTGTHFVNTDRFAPDPDTRAHVRAGLGDAGRFVALVVAYLIPEKGVDTLVRALARLPRSVVVWVIGEGPEAEPLKALAREVGVDDRLRWLGVRRRVEPFMQAADCLVCPSRWEEAAGLVNIEALAAGLPVVASAVGGIPEIIEEGRTGYLVPPDDPETLADRILFLVNEPARHQGMRSTARAEALDRYSTGVVLPEHLDFYRGLIPSRGRSANPRRPERRPLTTR